MGLKDLFPTLDSCKVLVTGHTGFKGSWLCLLLREAAAQVVGYSLPPESSPSLFHEANISKALSAQRLADIRHGDALRDFVHQTQPQLIFHLAAQPLVRRSYAQPTLTFDTNVMGTLALLEASTASSVLTGVVIVTSDKCYAPSTDPQGHQEGDALGGNDPYSASKACQELVAASWRASISTSALIATARAGNVIGGGDWAEDRLIPDLYRASVGKLPLLVRNPNALRPWQHVLDALTGYLKLGDRLLKADQRCAQAWNFGPSAQEARPVSWICDRAAQSLDAQWQLDPRASLQPHENAMLILNSRKSQEQLGWRPRWNVEQAVDQTMSWYVRYRSGAAAQALMLEQVQAYFESGR